MDFIFAANWKLHHSPAESRAFFKEWNIRRLSQDGKKFVFFPSAFSLEACSQSLSNQPDEFGAQNCYFETKGAFTGENSMMVAKELGAKWVLIGHSERRQIFSEEAPLLAKKIAKAQELGLTPLFCIGETLAEREAGQTLEVLKAQLEAGLELANFSAPLAVAYEPVWAIGTGRVAEVAQVAEAHLFLHHTLLKMGFQGVPLLYGGSVKPDNAAVLSRVPHLNGFLVGGASLVVDQFLKIAAQ